MVDDERATAGHDDDPALQDGTPLREVTFPAPDFERPVRVWRGPVEVRDGEDRLLSGIADVRLSWRRHSGARWTIEHRDVLRPLTDAFGRELTLKVAGASLSTYLTLQSVTRVEGAIAREGWMPRTHPPGHRVVAHWLNLPDYLGLPLHLGSRHGWRSWAGRSTWAQGPWTVTFHSRPETAGEWNRRRSEGGVHAAHVLEIVRSDGVAFTTSDVEPLLAALTTAASYLSGRWTGPALVRLQGRSGALRATEWGAVRVTQEHRSDSWWNRFLPFDQAMRPLVTLLLDEHSGPLAGRLLHTAVEANLDGIVEQQLVFLVTALDQLAWHRIVVEGNGDPDTWDRKKRLGQRIRRLLGLSGVPAAVPAQQPALRRRRQGHDIATVLSEMRNEIVHPRSVAGLDALWPHLIDAYLLAQETLDLCLLRWAGYDSRYGQRTHPTRWESTAVPVPWSADWAARA